MQVARVKLWQGLHGAGQALQHLHTLKVKLDDVSDRDACCLGLCVMPALTHLTLESNASAIGVTGAAGLVPLTSLRELVLPSQALGDQGLQVCAEHSGEGGGRRACYWSLQLDARAFGDRVYL